ncbi:TniQ family protein [Janthinobacterium sp. GW460P]|uniref:TnsD family Tn7-like transposition protein n=1 Tax=unclassified Janthinobacterium TaxID=2610881 RepID=UPI000A31EDD6|nr:MULTISPECIES: TnsD family Tn7-like transposition protein [unclassified Janthinobacterium]MCC7703519.1 TniQ family protein [Janthinobacterium sp. GW460P]MCC7709026.1 TniQ family protein [Janthinobacterium sp. GW460W]
MTQASHREVLPSTTVHKPASEVSGESYGPPSSSIKHACLCAPYLPDEVLISEIGRYHITSANRTTTETYRELFQCMPFNLNTSIPSHISILANMIEGNVVINTKHFLQTKTLFPLFETFTALEFKQSPRKGKMAVANPDNLPQRPRQAQRDPVLAPKRNVGDKTRLCLQCVHEDIRRFGVPFIHLSHQVPGVGVCAKHAVELIYKCPYCECPFNRQKELVLSLWKPCRCSRYLIDFASAEEKTDDAVALSYARFTARLLDLSIGPLQPIMLITCYKKRAHELGYTRGENIHRARLFEEIEKFYGAIFLSSIDSAYKKKRLTGWFNLINERYVTEVPLSRHLLVAHFLFRDAESFAQNAMQIRAGLLGDNVIHEKIRSKTGRRANTSQPPEQTHAKRTQELMREMLRAAQGTPECSLEILWRTNYGKMKLLTKLNPDAIVQLKSRLAKLKPRQTAPQKTALTPHPKDEERAKRVDEAAQRLYASIEKPSRVSRNRLERAIEWRPGGEATNHPSTCRMMKECLESNWHFYARRMVWAILHHRQASPSVIKAASGVEYHRSIELYNFFQTLDASTVLTEGTIMATLARYGIDRNWQGPCPERLFFSAGRGFYKHRSPS